MHPDRFMLAFPGLPGYNETTTSTGGGESTVSRDSMAFVVYMIHCCARQWNLTPAKVYQKLDESGCIGSYLVPHYEVLHTQSSRYILEDIRQYLERRGYAI